MANIVLNIEARQNASGQFEAVARDLGKLDNAATKTRAGLGSLTDGIKGTAAAFAAIGAGIAVVSGVGAALFKAAKDAADFAEGIANASANTGISTRTIQAFDIAAKGVGTSLETVTMAATRMAANLSKSPKVFEALGLDPETLRRLDPGKAFIAVAEKINGIGNASDKAAARIAVFGKAGATMQPLLDAVVEAENRLEDLGIALDDTAINALSVFDDKIDTLQVAVKGFWNQLGAAVAQSPAFGEAIDLMTRALAGMGRWIMEHRDDIARFFDSILAGALATAGGVLQIIQRFPGGQTLLNRLFGSQEEVGRLFDTIDRKIDKINARVNATNYSDLFKRAERAGTGAFNQISEAAERTRDKAEAAARKAEIEWEKAAVESRKEWDKFHEGMEQRGREALNAIEKSIKEGAKRSAEAFNEQVLAGLERYRENIKSLNEAVAELVERHRQAKLAMIDAWRNLAGVLAGQGGILGILGEVGVGIANIFDALENRAKTTADKINAIAGALSAIINGPSGGGRGGLSGLLAGAGAGAAIGGPIGAGIGALLGGVGGFLFGSGKKKREEAEEVRQLQAQLLSAFGSMEALRKKSAELGVSIDKAFSSKKPAEVRAVIDQLNAAMDAQRQRLEGLAQAADALTGIFTKLKPTTEAGAVAQATVFTSTFWATVKERGIGPAIDALSAPFDALNKSLTEKFGPELANRLLGSVSAFFDPRIKETISLFGDIQNALNGVAQAGFLTRDAFSAYQSIARDAFAQALAGGLSNADALRAIQPLLAAIIDASRKYGFTIDDATQALIDQAKAAGAAFPVDPITKAADAMEKLVQILAKIHGISLDVQDGIGGIGDAVDRLPNRKDITIRVHEERLPGKEPGFARGGIVAPPSWSIPRAANGILVASRPGFGTPVILGEGGSAEVAAPVAALFGVLGDKIAARVAGAVGARGPIMVSVQVDGREIARAVTRQTELGRINPQSRLRTTG